MTLTPNPRYRLPEATRRAIEHEIERFLATPIYRSISAQAKNERTARTETL